MPNGMADNARDIWRIIMYQIEIEYTTGNSFNTEEVTSVLVPGA